MKTQFRSKAFMNYKKKKKELKQTERCKDDKKNERVRV